MIVDFDESPRATIRDLKIGDSIAIEKTISESDVYLFAGICGDFSPNHINERYMQKTRFGTRIAQGALVVGFTSAAAAMFGIKYRIDGVSAGYDRLRFVAPVFCGDTILIHAAAGGVGMILSQWAKHLGATVIGTVGNEDKVEAARAKGCDHVLRYHNFAEQVRELTGGKGVPVVYDSIGKLTFEDSLKCLAPRGVLASFGESSGDPPPVSVRALGTMGSLYVTHPSLIDYTATRAELLETAGDLFAMVGSGKVKIEVNHVYPLREAAQAHRDMEGRKTTGSVVLIP